MKITAFVLLASITATYAVQDQTARGGEATLHLQCIPELSVLANGLAEQYQQEHGGALIHVSSIPAGNLDEALTSGGILLVNKGNLSASNSVEGLKMVVGRDVIVPVMNSNNPYTDLISQRGISPQQFASIYHSGGQLTWGQLLGTTDKHAVEAYVPQGSCAKAYLADFLGTPSDMISGTEPGSPEEMIGMIRANPNAIGFCTLACLGDMERNELSAGISIVPIDLDGDGSLEHFENIYGSYAELSHGVFVGKYPRELYSKIYALTAKGPATKSESAFLEWVIKGGQGVVASAGILTIDYGERASGLSKLHPESKIVSDVPLKASAGRAMWKILAGFAGLAVMIFLIIGRFGKTLKGQGEKAPATPQRFGESIAGYPGGLFYDRSHTWTFMEKTGDVRIGIDDFMQRVTGQVSRVVMKLPGEKIKRGESLFTIVQHGKQLKIKSPVSGVVVHRNESLQEDASLLNSDPYNEGWIYIIEPVNWMAEMKSFFIGEPYGEWLKAEFTQLKEFFASGLKISGSPNLHPVMQDGGEIMDGALEAFGPEVWEEFQASFINRKQ